jgi:excisionase family DNA binding protein
MHVGVLVTVARCSIYVRLLFVEDFLMAELEKTYSDRWLNKVEASKVLRISVSTLERRTKDGSIPSHKIGRLRRYRLSDLLNLGSQGA